MMKAICGEIADGKLTRMGSAGIAELRRQARQISNDNGKGEAARRYAHLVAEACEDELERLDAIEDMERKTEASRFACQQAACAA